MEWEGREGKEKEGKEKEGKGWWCGGGRDLFYSSRYSLFFSSQEPRLSPCKNRVGGAQNSLSPPFILIPADHFWGQLAALPPRPLCPFKAPAPLIDVSGPV